MNTKQSWILYGVIILSLMVAAPFIGWGIAKQFPLFPPITSADYPPATRDLAEIETWTEDEVWNLYTHLGCSNITFNSEFERQHPEVVRFCDSVRKIWSEKYKKSKEKDLNWDLFNSLPE